MTVENFQRRSVQVGADYERHVQEWVRDRGWSIEGIKLRHPCGIEIDILARDNDGELVAIECKGGNLEATAGLRRSDNIWKVLGQTLALHNWNRAHAAADRLRFLVITTAQPRDDERLAEPLRVAESENQVVIVVVPSESVS